MKNLIINLQLTGKLVLTDEQIDFALVQKRWWNSVQNAETDTQANIDTDHYPLTLTIKIRLKAVRPAQQLARAKYKECNPQEN